MRTRVLIAGAAGRDFHNFNVVYRGREEYEVVAFTATQIPDIAGRVYPPLLAGDLYPEGIPIRPEVKGAPGTQPIDKIKVIRPTIAELDKGIPEAIEDWRDTFGN